MSQTNAPEYVLGTHDDELHRLGLQHRLWFVAAHQLWERANIGAGKCILDVGCGPGFASMDMAQLVTKTGCVVGVDESKPYVEFANGQAKSRELEQARFYLGDVTNIDQVLEAQGVEAGSFDIAYVRWVMCFVSDPAAVIGSIAKMLKPGGRLLVQDYFNYASMCVAPRSEAFETVIAAIAKSWKDHGGDSDIMGRLPQIALDHGLELEHLSRAQIPTPRPGSTMWNWPASFWAVFVPKLVEMGYITEAQRGAFFEAWAQLSKNPAAFMHLPPMYEMIATKPG
jgi:ubiquinone/menaquinone biosynthesis C-methylase UbiE